MPAHLRRLLDVNYPLEALQAARDWFADHDISIGYSIVRRSWYAQRIGRPGESGPTTVTVWLGLGALVEYLDAPSSLVAAFAAKRGAA